MNLLNEGIKLTRVLAYQADGQGDPDSSRVDMSGFDGVMFICELGTIDGGGTVTMVAKQAATDIVGDALSGASVAAADDDDNKLLAIDIFRPTDRYLGVSLTRAVANSVIGGVTALQYHARTKPTTHTSASMAAAAVALVSPAEA